MARRPRLPGSDQDTCGAQDAARHPGLHPAQEKRAKPLQLEALEQTCAWLEQQREQARQQGRFGDLLRHTRDKALLLIGFWRGFRSDELARLEIDRIEAVPAKA
jgi:hypothetical protein